MADIVKATGAGLSTLKPGPEHKISSDLFAGEALATADVCYIKNDGSVWRSNGTAANAAAKADGILGVKASVGDAVTLFRGVQFYYSAGLLTPGARYYVSATTAGGLSDAATTGGTAPVAFATDTQRIFFHGSVY